MKAYPLVHTRTKHCDYNSNFLMRQSNLNLSEAREKILAATRSIEHLDGVRYICFSTQKHYVFGVIMTNKYLISQVGLSQEDQENNYIYTIDEIGRSIFGFFGFTIEKKEQNLQQIPLICKKDLFDVFKKYIIPIWYEKEHKTILDTVFDLEAVEATEILSTPEYSKQNYQYFISEYKKDKALFNATLAEMIVKKNDCSLCTNIESYPDIKNGVFSIYSTTKNNISRVENDFHKEEKRLEDERLKVEEQQTLEKEQEQERENSKRIMSFNKKKIVATALIIVIIGASVAILSGKLIR